MITVVHPPPLCVAVADPRGMSREPYTVTS
jgi:hypothetical protein